MSRKCCLRVVHDCVNSSLQNRAKHGVFSFMHQGEQSRGGGMNEGRARSDIAVSEEAK